MIRMPAVAGQFYPYSPDVLLGEIAEFMGEPKQRRQVSGVMVPHAGYMYSGGVAGLVYSRIEPADSYVILGPNHTGLGLRFSIVRGGLWRTPLGEVSVDSIIADEILRECPIVEEDILAHQREHSIEVQLPFLQYLGDDFMFVPICIGHLPLDDETSADLKSIGRAVASAIRKFGGKTVVVASTDLTHYESQESAKIKDADVLEAVLKLDPEKLLKVVSEKDISMCGVLPTAIMLYACKELGASKAELAGYQTSGDVTGDLSQVVGYGGVLVF
ncbi:MAG: AmmeMemoRadiSam system protein B [Methanobacteriota archaeon]